MSASDDTPEYKKLVDQEVTRLKAVHPTFDDIPSCTGLFDLVLSCHTIRSQVKSWYRFGHGPTTCGYKMDDFKFCMGMKSMEADERYEAWIQRKARWWADKRLDKSSEDVWEMREKPCPFPPPFSDQEIQDIRAMKHKDVRNAIM